MTPTWCATPRRVISTPSSYLSSGIPRWPIAFSLRMLGNHYDAQDLAQESLLAAWRNLDRFRGESSFSTWLYRIITRRALNRLTRGKVHHSIDLLDDVPAHSETDPQLSHERRATADAVTAAVASLPLPQRTAVVLHHFEGLSYEDVAAITHSSLASVRSHLFRARRNLAVLLADEKAAGRTVEEANT